MDVYGRVVLGHLATANDGNGEMPKIVIGEDRRHVLVCRVDDTCEIRSFTPALDVVATFPVPSGEVPVAFAIAPRVAVWSTSAIPAGGEPVLEDLVVTSFDESEGTPFTALQEALPPRGPFDTDDVLAVQLESDGTVRLAVSARRGAAVTVHVARYREGRLVGHEVVDTFAAPPSPAVEDVPAEILGVIAEAQEQAAELSRALPWDAPQVIETDAGPGLLFVGAGRSGLVATLWR